MGLIFKSKEEKLQENEARLKELLNIANQGNYYFVISKDDMPGRSESFDYMHKNGWELVCSYPTFHAGDVYFIFKRIGRN